MLVPSIASNLQLYAKEPSSTYSSRNISCFVRILFECMT